MSRRAPRTFGGLAVSKQKARFIGNLTLEDQEYDASGIDNTVVMVVVANVGKFDMANTDEGLQATVIYKVSEMRMLENGPLRTQVVEQLGLYGFDTLPFDVPAPKVDPDTGEVAFDGFKSDEPVEEKAVLDGEVVEAVRAYEANVQPRRTGGPKSLPFTYDDIPDPSPHEDRETIGSIYDGLNRDQRTASFTSEDSRG